MTDIIRELWEAEADLARAKLRHTAAKAAVQAAMFHDISEGSRTVDIGSGWRVNGLFKINRTVDSTPGKVAAVCQFLPREVPAELFKASYRLGLTTYNKLEPGQRQHVDTVVTTKPAAPVIKLLAPGTNE